MKKMKLRLLLCKFLLAIGLLSGPILMAQTFEKSRSVSRSFAVDDNTEVQIINKYGNIHLLPWDQDSVRFDIELKVISTKQSKLDKTFDYIDFDFRASRYYVIAQTIFQGKTAFWTEVTDLASTIFSSGTKTEIDYTVYLPEDIYLRAELKFGNIYATDHSGRLFLKISNGDLKAHALTGETQLDIEFGNANIYEFSEGKISSRYAEISIETCGPINISSKSTQWEIETAESLMLESYRDRYTIGKIGSITGSTSVSETKIERITQKVDLKTNYGDIRVEGFGDDNQACTLNSTYTDINLYLERHLNYKLDISYTDRTVLSYPSGIDTPEVENVNGDKARKRVSFSVGDSGFEAIPVRINATDGNIFLRMK